MKNLKKVLALVVALTMVLGTVGFAFTDVTEENEVYTAVQTLSSLEILKGYDDGTFGAEKDITRSEFAAVVVRALGLESSANGAKGATQFSDVAADHWASGYINLAAGQGIINGYPDGRFGPDDNVTYEQAIKMLVVALGYEPMASQKGGYPTGYLVVANTYGMTKGVSAPADNAPANRGMVAQLTYNALDIPVMKQVGFGSEVVYGIYDGESYKPYTSLLSGLEVAKLEGVVSGTPVIGGSALAIDQITYTVDEVNDDPTWSKWIGDADKKDYDFTVAEGVNAADYFGIASIIYAKEVRSGKWEIIAIMPGEDSVIVELDRGDIDDITSAKIEYYESEAATKTTKLNLDSVKGTDAGTDENSKNIIINNVYSDIDAIKALGADAEIMVIENTGDSKYDMIVAKNYTYSVVEEVEADRDRFTTKDLRRFAFDFEDDTVVNSIVNKDGEAIELADFAEGDVIAYILEDGNKSSNFKWIEIINLGANAVTGVVTEKSDENIYVDGVAYELTSNAPAMKVNDEGTYYLTRTGKVFDTVKDSSVASNYAYILEAALNPGTFNECWQFKLLTKDGSITIYDVKDKFTVNGVAYDKVGDSAGNIGGLEVIGTTGHKDPKTDVNLRLVTFKLDSNNKIREINTVTSTAVGTAGNGKEFNQNSGAVDNKVLEDDVVIFNIADTSASSTEDAYVTGLSSLVHESKYVGHIVFNAEDKGYDAFVITEGIGAIDFAQDIAVIDSINQITLDDDDAWKIRYYTANETELKELTLTGDTKVSGSTMNTTLANTLAKGTAFMFTADENGVASNFEWIAKASDSVSPSDAAYTLNTTIVDKINADEDLEFVHGYIVEFSNASKGVNIKYTGTRENNAVTEDLLPVTASTNAFTYYNRTSSKVSIVSGDWRGANEIDKAIDGKATFFFAIAENGVASDIVTFSTRKAY